VRRASLTTCAPAPASVPRISPHKRKQQAAGAWRRGAPGAWRERGQTRLAIGDWSSHLAFDAITSNKALGEECTAKHKARAGAGGAGGCWRLAAGAAGGPPAQRSRRERPAGGREAREPGGAAARGAEEKKNETGVYLADGQ
jgi:hypothetical protein